MGGSRMILQCSAAYHVNARRVLYVLSECAVNIAPVFGEHWFDLNNDRTCGFLSLSESLRFYLVAKIRWKYGTEIYLICFMIV